MRPAECGIGSGTVTYCYAVSVKFVVGNGMNSQLLTPSDGADFLSVYRDGDELRVDYIRKTVIATVPREIVQKSIIWQFDKVLEYACEKILQSP